MESSLTDLQLAEIDLDALFVHDTRGRIVRTNEPDGRPAPKFDFWRTRVGNIWRVTRIGTQRVRTEARSTADLARFPVSESALRVDFFRGVDDTEPDKSFAYDSMWAVLKLIQEPFARRLPGGKEWEVMVSLKDDAGQERFLLLIVQFEKPLPELEQWPSATQLAL